MKVYNVFILIQKYLHCILETNKSCRYLNKMAKEFYNLTQNSSSFHLVNFKFPRLWHLFLVHAKSSIVRGLGGGGNRVVREI